MNLQLKHKHPWVRYMTVSLLQIIRKVPGKYLFGNVVTFINQLTDQTVSRKKINYWTRSTQTNNTK